MVEIKMKRKCYSDVEYVEGVFMHNRSMEDALWDHCKRYFDENYRGVFFAGEDLKDEICHEAFITLWENIEHRRIYVEDGMLKGKDGMTFSGKLTTYFMSIARFKYLEIARERNREVDAEERKIPLEKLNLDSYNDLLYGDEERATIDMVSECLRHMSERCHQILTMFYLDEKTLDDIMNELQSFKSKDALKTAKYKCLENLRKSSKELYRIYINS
jgi:DNA-directed RNA polymerase specialized sigma24 family protein